MTAPGDPVRVILPAGPRAGLVEAVHGDSVRVWLPSEAGGFSVTVPVEKVEAREAV